MRKIIYDLVPSMGIEIEHGTKHRLGLKLKVPKYNYKKKEDSLSVRGPEVWNSLPKDIRNLDCSMDTFKQKLDIYLNMIPDVPRIDARTMMVLNNLKVQIANWKWQISN